MKKITYIFLTLFTLLCIKSFSQTAMPASGALVGSGSGSWIVPSNVYSIKIDAWGGGGAGTGQSTTGTGGLAGGAGGSHSISTISVTPGQIIYWVVGASRTGTSGNAANGNDTWVNELTNSAPTSSNDGVLAKGGQSAVGTTAGVGTTTNSVGQTIYRGGSGRVGGVTSGGGGSGAGTSANGTDATGTAGATAPSGGGNGGSGHASGGNGTAGSTPGGGGGGAFKNNTTSRNGGAGAAGRVILTYTAIPVCATLTSPTNNSTDILLSQTLNWGVVSNATSYDVYFGTNSSPPFVVNQSGTSYTPTLSNSTTYYWKVIPKNSAGTALSCSTWSFTTSTPGCTNGTLYPSTTYSPSCSGSFENITTLGYAGEYSNVSLISNVQYTFNSSVSTDFITITNSGGTTKYIYGTTPITYTPTSDEVVRFYTHTNSNCGTQSVSRTRQVKCSIPPPSNDLCSGAISTTCDVTWNGSTNYATQTGDSPSCFTDVFETWTAPGVWYKVVGNGQNITLSLCTGTSFDTKLFVYTGVCGSLTCLTYNDDDCSTQSRVTFTSTNNTDYYVLVTGYGSAKGNFQLGVTYTSSPPTITTQPINLQTCTTPQTFSVVASGVRTPFTYQWYRNGVSISGANSGTYSTSTLGNYYVQVTNSCNQSTNSNTVTLSLATSPIVTIPSSSQICAGGSGTNNITSSVTLGIPTYTYQWQFNNSGWSNTVTTSTINATPSVTRDYRVIVTDGNGCKDTSNIHTVTVIPDPINPTLNTKTPNTNNVCVGTDLSATFNSGSSGVGCSDIFQYTINGTSWSNYILGTTISTSSLSDGITVQIRGRRGNCTTGIGCTNNAYDILSSWTIAYPPTSTLTSINVSCNGGSDGSIDLTPTGNSPFTFSWSNGGTIEDISNLTSGNYSVTITDNNLCSSTNSVTITQPTLLTSSLTSVNVSCFNGVNGSINLTPSGGTSPYTYSWSNGSTNQDLNNVPANTYSVTITDSKGCTTTNSVTITQPSTITLTTSVTNVNCFGESNGSLSVTNISGGTSPYIILWGNGSNQNTISNLTAGNYNVTITDNKGCNKITTLNVAQPSQLSLGLNIVNYPNCGSSNGSITSSIVGGTPPYFYLWSNGSTSQNLTNIPSGDYTLTVTDSKNCTTQNIINLGCTSVLINVGQIDGITPICGVNSTTYTINYSNTSPNSITWILPNGVTSSNGLSSQNVNVTFSSGFIQDSIEVDVVSNGITYHRSIWVSKLPNKPTISGNFCGDPIGSVKQYVITNSQPNTTYTWVPPYGVNVFSGQGNDTTQLKFSMYLVTGSGGSVTATNACSTTTKTFTIDKYVTRPTSILGPSTVCADGNTIYTYRVDSVPTSFNYIWGLPNGVSLVGNNNNDTIKVKFSTTFTSGQFSVMSVNQCGSSPMTYGSVSNNNLYSNIGTISGPGDLCPYLGQSVTYSVTNQSGTFTWSVPTNMTIQSGQGTNVINVLVSNSFVSGTISVNLNNGCGGSVLSTKTLSTTQSTISSSSISGVRSVCSIIGTNTSTTFSVTPISGVNYNWSVPVNSTIVSGQGTNSIQVTFQNGFTGGNIQLVITGGCGNPVTLTRVVSVGLPTVTINGSSCVNNGYTNTYSVSTTGALSFTWSVPNNAQIVSGQGTNSISVFFPSNFESTCINNSCDSIKLTTQFSCGTVKSTRRIGLLTQRPTITGINQACFPDTIMLTASISPRNTSYIWSSPNGTSFIGSTTGNVVYAKTSSSFFGGTFSVMGVNTCGSSPMGYFGVNKVCDVRMVGLDENDNKDLDFIVYPNPGKGIMEFRVFRGESDIYFVEVKNSLGQVVYSGYNKSEDQLNLTNLNTGIYFIMVRNNKNNTLIKELFIIE
jgi:hypothetical protein